MEEKIAELERIILDLSNRVRSLEEGRKKPRAMVSRAPQWDIDPKSFMVRTNSDDDKVRADFLLSAYSRKQGSLSFKALGMLMTKAGVKRKRTANGIVYLGIKLI